MLGNLWMPGIALIVGTRPLPRAGKARAPCPSRLLPLRKPRPLRLLSQGTGMWGMRGGGGPARWGEEVGKGGLPSRRRQLALAVCLPVTFQKRNSEGTKGFFKITAPGWCGPGASRCPVLPPSSCEGVRRTELGPNCILQHRSQAW